MSLKSHLCLLFHLLAPLPLLANNVNVTNVTLTGLNTITETAQITMDITWDNSWYDNENHDAVWLFIKYRVNTGDNLWRHATLSTTGHNAPTSMSLEQNNSTGVFLRRSEHGTGTANAPNLQLQWQYATDLKQENPNQNITPTDVIEIKVHAIEMVYIPQGPYYLGDGTPPTAGTLMQQFQRADSPTTPYQVTSEQAITLGSTNPANLSSTDNTIMGPYKDDFDSQTIQTLPAAFPKGYQGYYLMKHNPTQEQYADFLNTLTRQQQNSRIENPNDHQKYSLQAPYDPHLAERRLVIKPNGPPTSESIPQVFICDLNNNGIPNEIDDGQTLAVLGILWEDATAYLDWAGLRPMTELEYEKACRGPLHPIPGEFPWGTLHIASDHLTLLNPGTPQEIPNQAILPNSNVTSTYHYSGSPRRVGMHAGNTPTETRESAGAGYYGALDLAGNGEEHVVTISTPQGRSYTGNHGDGKLDPNGNANVQNWPGPARIGTGRKAVAHQNQLQHYKTSDRMYVNGIDYLPGTEPDPQYLRYYYAATTFRGAYTYPNNGTQP